MYSVIEKIKKLSGDLYPDGRAFVAALEGVRNKLHAALAISEEKAFNDALSILDSTIADNANFDEDDADQWERRLGLITSPGTPLATRIMAINRKLNYPITDAPRQHYTFIEDQLVAAGFDVKVYENNFSGVTMTPEEILTPGAPSGSVHSVGTFHKSTTLHGSTAFYTNKVVNYLEEEKDANFIIGANYRSTFFVAGVTVDTFADVPAARKLEFRQLILRLKPQQTVGFLFVNYI